GIAERRRVRLARGAQAVVTERRPLARAGARVVAERAVDDDLIPERAQAVADSLHDLHGLAIHERAAQIDHIAAGMPDLFGAGEDQNLGARLMLRYIDLRVAGQRRDGLIFRLLKGTRTGR